MQVSNKYIVKVQEPFLEWLFSVVVLLQFYQTVDGNDITTLQTIKSPSFLEVTERQFHLMAKRPGELHTVVFFYLLRQLLTLSLIAVCIAVSVSGRVRNGRKI